MNSMIAGRQLPQPRLAHAGPAQTANSPEYRDYWSPAPGLAETGLASKQPSATNPNQKPQFQKIQLTFISLAFKTKPPSKFRIWFRESTFKCMCAFVQLAKTMRFFDISETQCSVHALQGPLKS